MTRRTAWTVGGAVALTGVAVVGVNAWRRRRPALTAGLLIQQAPDGRGAPRGPVTAPEREAAPAREAQNRDDRLPTSRPRNRARPSRRSSAGAAGGTR